MRNKPPPLNQIGRGFGKSDFERGMVLGEGLVYMAIEKVWRGVGGWGGGSSLKRGVVSHQGFHYMIIYLVVKNSELSPMPVYPMSVHTLHVHTRLCS